jgi:hypothetical protein
MSSDSGSLLDSPLAAVQLNRQLPPPNGGGSGGNDIDSLVEALSSNHMGGSSNNKTTSTARSGLVSTQAGGIETAGHRTGIKMDSFEMDGSVKRRPTFCATDSPEPLLNASPSIVPLPDSTAGISHSATLRVLIVEVCDNAAY